MDLWAYQAHLVSQFNFTRRFGRPTAALLLAPAEGWGALRATVAAVKAVAAVGGPNWECSVRPSKEVDWPVPPLCVGACVLHYRKLSFQGECLYLWGWCSSHKTSDCKKYVYYICISVQYLSLGSSMLDLPGLVPVGSSPIDYRRYLRIPFLFSELQWRLLLW